MSVFNSLGSNYNFNFVLKSLFTFGGDGEVLRLKKNLEEKYNGDVILFYKGREAITFALESLNLPKNSAVAFTGFTCYAVYKAIGKAGFKPIPIDIGFSLNFSSIDLRRILNGENIKALIVQNTFGYPCAIEEILKICKEKNIILIEDLAHCAGGEYENGKEAGTIGDFTVLSFSQDKIIDGISGGALAIRNKKYQKSIINSFKNPSLALQLKDRFYPLLTFKIRVFYEAGGKLLHFVLKKTKILSTPMQETLYKFSNLPGWYCSLINYQFNNFDKELKHRRQIAKIYKEKLSKKIINDETAELVDLSSNLRFPIFVENRKDLIKYLKKNNIYVSDIWYDAPIAPERYLIEPNFENNLPNSKRISELVLNLPTHENVSFKNAQKICDLINKWGGRA